MTEIADQSDNSIINSFSKFELFLEQIGLPTDNIIAEPSERETIINQIPNFVSKLSPEIKKNARYLSKFVAGAAVGLFDASLNFVWDEVVCTLRKKVSLYGLDLFFDQAVGEKHRSEYNNEEDLKGIKDKTLLDTCRKLELISNIVYKKLCHILSMRNDIGASHPNDYFINSYELLGWLKTCIDEVIGVEPSKSALTIKSVIENLKNNTSTLPESMVNQFKNSIKQLSPSMVDNLLNTMFGIFISDSTNKTVRENILILAPIIWEYSDESIKYDLGDKIGVMEANLFTKRSEYAKMFFNKCKGNSYLNISTRIAKLSSLCDELLSANDGWNNYYNEPIIIRDIMSYIKNDRDIPDERSEKIIKTILKCRIGKNVEYCNGVSPRAKVYYDKFLKLLNKNQVILCLKIFENYDIKCLLFGDICIQNAVDILNMLKSELNSDKLNELIEYMIDNKKNLDNIQKSSQYKTLKKGIW